MPIDYYLMRKSKQFYPIELPAKWLQRRAFMDGGGFIGVAEEEGEAGLALEMPEYFFPVRRVATKKTLDRRGALIYIRS